MVRSVRGRAPEENPFPKTAMMSWEPKVAKPRRARLMIRIQRVTVLKWVRSSLESDLASAAAITGMVIGSKLWRTFLKVKAAFWASP